MVPPDRKKAMAAESEWRHRIGTYLQQGHKESTQLGWMQVIIGDLDIMAFVPFESKVVQCVLTRM